MCNSTTLSQMAFLGILCYNEARAGKEGDAMRLNEREDKGDEGREGRLQNRDMHMQAHTHCAQERERDATNDACAPRVSVINDRR